MTARQNDGGGPWQEITRVAVPTVALVSRTRVDHIDPASERRVFDRDLTEPPEWDTFISEAVLTDDRVR